MHEMDAFDAPVEATPVDLKGAAVDIPAVLTALAQAQPDVPAFMAPGRPPLGFAGLHRQMQYTRATLRAWSIERGDPVAVSLPKGPEMASVCALLPAAATCLPLDPKHSVEDCERIYRRCAVRAVIVPRGTDGAAAEAAGRLGLMRIGLETDPIGPAGTFDLALERRSTTDRAISPCDRNTAYILCTSGTTAQNKLVPIGHRQLVGYAAVAKNYYDYRPTDIGLHIVPHHLSHGVKAALMVPLLSGTSIVCASDFEVDTFFALLETYRPTWLTCGFTLHREILRNIDGYRHIVDKTALRFFGIGSGKLEEHEIAGLEQAFRAPAVVKLSSTETCLISASPLGFGKRKPGSVGKAQANEVAIRGSDGRVLGADEEGEIIVRGPLVFDGYIDDPAQTRAAFVDGWYRTGDLGKFDSDGDLFVTGRIKEMINRGGEKISPLEIDAILESHPDVDEAAAFGLPHPTLGELVVAAVVPRPHATSSEKDIRQHARERLARSKVPSKLFIVEKLPRTDSGKLRRAWLKETFAPRPGRA